MDRPKKSVILFVAPDRNKSFGSELMKGRQNLSHLVLIDQSNELIGLTDELIALNGSNGFERVRESKRVQESMCDGWREDQANRSKKRG